MVDDVKTDRTSPESDYAAVGGGAAVSSVVDLFYQRVLADPQLAGYFEGSDLVRLKRHQVQLVSQVMGGPVTYEGAELAAAHADRGITDADFGKVVEHLIAALQAHDVDEEIIGRVVEALAATQGDIVTAAAN
ncbi:MAG TPA: group 1 truncated hemoglobin [Kribbella sp.]|nr:group 1 truncated hemoglobin [Kribbella sp.]